MITEADPLATRTWRDFREAWKLFFEDNGVSIKDLSDPVMLALAYHLYTGCGFLYNHYPVPDPWYPADTAGINAVFAFKGLAVVCCGSPRRCDRDLTDKLNRMVYQFLRPLTV